MLASSSTSGIARPFLVRSAVMRNILQASQAWMAPSKSVGLASQGNSQQRKFRAAIAMPTPKWTPASTRFDPPSPKAKVSPDTTMATSDSPRAIVLVNACWRTFTAFSDGEVRVIPALFNRVDRLARHTHLGSELCPGPFFLRSQHAQSGPHSRHIIHSVQDAAETWAQLGCKTTPSKA